MNMRNRELGNLKHYLRNYVAKGTTLPAGEYTYAEGSTDYTLTLDREVSFLGDVNLMNPGEDTNQLLKCLATDDKAGMFIPAGDCIVPAEKQDGSISLLYFVTPHAIGTRLDKYSNPVCDLIDAGYDKCLGYGISGRVYTLVGSVKYRFEQTPGFKFEADNGKSIAKVGVCLPDKFNLHEQFQAQLIKAGQIFSPNRQLSVVFGLIQLKMDTSVDNTDLEEMFHDLTSIEKFSQEALHELKIAINMSELILGSDEVDLQALVTVFDKILPTLDMPAADMKVAKAMINAMVVDRVQAYELKLKKYQDNVIEEYSLSQACPDLRARSPLFGSSLRSRPIGCQLMRKMPGVDLLVHLNNECLEPDDPNFRMLSIHDCLQICLGSFVSLKKQMHDNGLVHRDLKPENIMGDGVNGRWIINIIDAGLSRFAHTQDNRTCGNAEYSAPETCLGQSVLASDVYSLAKVAANILANVIEDAPKSIQFELLAFINHCMSVEVDARPSLQECIETLTTIYFDYKKLTLMIPQNQHNNADKGFILGKKAANVFFSVSGKRINKLDVDTFINSLNAIIDQLPNNPYAVHAFIDVIDAKCLHGITNKTVLKTKVNEVTNLLFQRYDAVKLLRDELLGIREQASRVEECMPNTDFAKVIALNSHITQLDQFLAANKYYTFDLDTLQAQATHFNNKLIKTRTAKNYFEGLLPANPDVAPVALCRK
jgi:serine/threonine protein kinase